MIGPTTVLVVEDEAFTALGLAQALEEGDHEVCGIAADKAEALRLGERFRPDAALVDINLADGPTGLEITREPWLRHGVACVLTTAYPPEAWPKAPHGAWGRLGKPYDPEGAGASVAHCLALARGGRPSDAAPPGLELLLV